MTDLTLAITDSAISYITLPNLLAKYYVSFLRLRKVSVIITTSCRSFKYVYINIKCHSKHLHNIHITRTVLQLSTPYRTSSNKRTLQLADNDLVAIPIQPLVKAICVHIVPTIVTFYSTS